MMPSSRRSFHAYITSIAAIWVLAFWGQCEATTVPLTAGPYSTSRRQIFGSRGWSNRRSKVSAPVFDVPDTEAYKEVEECSVSLT